MEPMLAVGLEAAARACNLSCKESGWQRACNDPTHAVLHVKKGRAGWPTAWPLSPHITAQVLWALDVRTGASVLPPTVISGVGYSGGQAFTFTPNIQNNRLGLAFDGTNVRAPPMPAQRLPGMYPCDHAVMSLMSLCAGRCTSALGATATSLATRRARAGLL
jgi:hypothetical protein